MVQQMRIVDIVSLTVLLLMMLVAISLAKETVFLSFRIRIESNWIFYQKKWEWIIGALLDQYFIFYENTSLNGSFSLHS